MVNLYQNFKKHIIQRKKTLHTKDVLRKKENGNSRLP